MVEKLGGHFYPAQLALCRRLLLPEVNKRLSTHSQRCKQSVADLDTANIVECPIPLVHEVKALQKESKDS